MLIEIPVPSNRSHYIHTYIIGYYKQPFSQDY